MGLAEITQEEKKQPVLVETLQDLRLDSGGAWDPLMEHSVNEPRVWRGQRRVESKKARRMGESTHNEGHSSLCALDKNSLLEGTETRIEWGLRS